jgi:hypothetical protein
MGCWHFALIDLCCLISAAFAPIPVQQMATNPWLLEQARLFATRG